MLIGIAYLALFLAAGLLLARWAVPDGSPAVAVPLGDQQVHDGVDPHDIFRRIVGGRSVKPGKDTFKRRGIF